jgi:hypothetical protein
MTGLSNDTTYTFTVTATNKNGTGPASGASNAVTPSVVLPLSTECGGEGQVTCPTFRYTLDDPGNDFSDSDYVEPVDGGWTDGLAPFAEEPAEQCSFPDGKSPFPVNGDVWIRVTFELPEGASNLQIVGTIDNVATFFVNGTEVGQVSDGSCDLAFEPIDIDDHLLLPGTNVIAVHAEDTGSRSFLDFTVQYTDPDTEETQVAATSSPGATTTTSTTSTSTTTSTTTTTLPAPIEETTTTTTTTAAAPTE